MDEEQAVPIVGGAAVAAGLVGALAPRVIARLFGLSTDDGELALLVRLHGIGNAALGLNLMQAAPAERRRLLTVAAIADGVATALVLAAPVSGRTKLLFAATSGSIAGLAASAARSA